MDRTNFLKKRTEAGDLFARVLVVFVGDMSDQVSERFFLPVPVLLCCTCLLLGHLQ